MIESVSGNCCSITLMGTSPSATDVQIIAAECGGAKPGSVNLVSWGWGHGPVCDIGG